MNSQEGKGVMKRKMVTNKIGIMAAVQEKARFNKKDTIKVTDTIFKTISNALQKGTELIRYT